MSEYAQYYTKKTHTRLFYFISLFNVTLLQFYTYIENTNDYVI